MTTTTANTTTTLLLPAKEGMQAIRASLLVASSDRMRPILYSVLCVVKDKEAKFVATDSYRLSIITVAAPDSADGTIVVDGDMLRAACKTFTKSVVAKIHDGTSGPGRQILTLTDGGTFQTLNIAGHQFPGSGNIGSFPEYERLIPNMDAAKEYDGEWPALNPHYLATLSGIAKELQYNEHLPARMTSFGSTKPVIIDFIPSEGSPCRYLLMPVRVK